MGKRIIPFQFIEAYEFKNGVAKVAMSHEGKRKFGMINPQGNTIIPCIYDELGDFYDDLVVAKKEDKYGFVDKKGKSTFEY